MINTTTLPQSRMTSAWHAVLDGRTPAWLAGELGVTPPTVSRWLRGARTPSVEHVAQALAAVSAPLPVQVELWAALGVPAHVLREVDRG